MKVHLMNSAMMPQEGRYVARRISHEAFCQYLCEAEKNEILESYIGYQQNIDLIRKWTNIEVPLNRSETKLKDGDVMLVMKLAYRLDDPAQKGQPVDEHSFEYYYIEYYDLRGV